MTQLNTGDILEDSENNLVRVVEIRDKEIGLLTLTGKHAGKLGFLPHSDVEEWSEATNKMDEPMMERVYSQLYGNYFPEGKWVNVGDASPRQHGGIFVKWKKEFVSGDLPDGYWRIITTMDAKEMGLDDMVEQAGRYMFNEYMISPDDIWKDPLAPEKGLDASGVMSVVGEGDTHPANVERLVQAIPHAAQEINHGRDTYTDNYWEKANNYGIYQDSV